MRNQYGGISDLKVRVFLAGVTIVGMIVLAGLNQHSSVRGAGTEPTARVTAIQQITHDGYRKMNLLADDSQLYVTELPTANRVIAKVSLPNFNRSVVACPFPSLQVLDLSSDHSKLLISSVSKSSGENEFWTLPLSAGSPKRVSDLSGRDASWSPDGKQLVFAKGSTLSVADGTGSQAHPIYTANGAIFAPRFSPDGRRIRFTVSDSELNTTALWEVASDGSNARGPLGDWPLKATACCGSWTVDGRYYIFQATQTLPNTTVVVTSLWALSEAGSNVVPIPLTSGPMSFGNVSAGRNSQNLWAIGVQPIVEIVKYEPEKKRFVPVIPGLSATDLDYSKDGNWITYVAVPDGTLWRARADGSKRLQLTSATDRVALPRWSPDGKQIAYVSMKPGESWKLWLIPADGGTPKPVVQENGSQIDANWSSDGSQLMFGDYSHDANGLSIRILDFRTNKVVPVPGSEGLFSPRWSPDGKHIAAISPDNTTLMLYDFATQKWSTWLKETAGTVSYPVWSPDSNYLYFDDLVTDEEAIRRVKVGGTEPEKVFALGSLDRYPGALGPWTGVAPDGSWMFVQDRSTQEVYQLSLDLP